MNVKERERKGKRRGKKEGEEELMKKSS